MPNSTNKDNTSSFSEKKKTLETMYKSVERMNQHVVNNNSSGVIAEQYLQRNLRSNFCKLNNKED